MNLSHPLELVSHPLDGRILEALSGADAAYTGRQVHALIGQHSVGGVQAGLDRLSRQGILSAQPAGRAVLYRLNADHLAAAHIRGLAHLRYELVRRLRSELGSWHPRPATAHLFGSTARRDSTADSDIDILLVWPRELGDPDRPDWRDQVDALSSAVTAWTGNDTRVVELGEDEVRSIAASDPLLASIREEGIHLAGDDRLIHPTPPSR
ncbi:MAG TPA: nucleotidyltransferase domain-containing protein [Candidatus Dormibacteraeota bacterium]|nr:nucleotidyltransferase domain-containing protein [Candidatus Dormibacteraeota bacterium]